MKAVSAPATSRLRDDLPGGGKGFQDGEREDGGERRHDGREAQK